MSKLILNRNLNFILKRATRSSSNLSSTLFNTVDQFGRQGGNAVAIFDENGQHTYADVTIKSDAVAKALIDEKIFDRNVTYLCPNDARYTFATFGIW